MFDLAAPGVVVTIDPVAGGRVSAMRLAGRDLLVGPETANGDPLRWGSYPMVPYAGRVRHGRFTFGGRAYHVPITMPPHAIHGTTYERPWSVSHDGSLGIELGGDWPFGGHAVQRFGLGDASFTCTIEVHNDHRSMPAMAGWHPWFVRPVSLTFAARAMYERDHEGIPTGTTVSPPPRPWDDCFTDVVEPPRLTWPEGPTITMTSSCDHWVVYDEPAHALCVEPQTGPPDAFTIAPKVVEPGHPLVAWMTWSW